jgi:hypothetical protein
VRTEYCGVGSLGKRNVVTASEIELQNMLSKLQIHVV